MNEISKLINLRKVAKANKHITTERILYKEAINCPNLGDCDALVLGCVIGQQTLRIDKNTLPRQMSQAVNPGNAINF